MDSYLTPYENKGIQLEDSWVTLMQKELEKRNMNPEAAKIMVGEPSTGEGVSSGRSLLNAPMYYNLLKKDAIPMSEQLDMAKKTTHDRVQSFTPKDYENDKKKQEYLDQLAVGQRYV